MSLSRQKDIVFVEAWIEAGSRLLIIITKIVHKVQDKKHIN